MATRIATEATTNSHPPMYIYTWTGLNGATSDVGDAKELGWLSDKCVQILGTIGTFDLQGSNDGTNWHTLNDAGGTPIDETGGVRTEQILENTRYVRPSVSGAASGVTVIIVGKASLV